MEQPFKPLERMIIQDHFGYTVVSWQGTGNIRSIRSHAPYCSYLSSGFRVRCEMELVCSSRYPYYSWVDAHWKACVTWLWCTRLSLCFFLGGRGMLNLGRGWVIWRSTCIQADILTGISFPLLSFSKPQPQWLYAFMSISQLFHGHNASTPMSVISTLWISRMQK